MEVALPWLQFRQAAAADIELSDKEGKKISQAEKEFMLTEYDEMIDPINKYGDIAIQYGFMIMFITALPIATFAAIFTCMLRIQADGWLLLSVE
jgi:hypothetical protein